MPECDSRTLSTGTHDYAHDVAGSGIQVVERLLEAIRMRALGLG